MQRPCLNIPSVGYSHDTYQVIITPSLTTDEEQYQRILGEDFSNGVPQDEEHRCEGHPQRQSHARDLGNDHPCPDPVTRR